MIHPFSQFGISLVPKRDVTVPELAFVLHKFVETRFPRFATRPYESNFIQLGDAVLGQVFVLVFSPLSLNPIPQFGVFFVVDAHVAVPELAFVSHEFVVVGHPI